ncbi:WbqC family protein [Paraglaciecola polaris]|nr:WbqC family protein [Paraglaciecola polaris]
MKLGIMQPYFFPYLGHFALIDAVDKWIVFDVSQYTPKSWMNRNRILHPNTGFNYVTLPLEKSSIKLRTCDVHVRDIDNVKATILGKISHYKKQAPFYWQVVNIIKRTFENAKSNKLVDINVSALDQTCQYLGLTFDWDICSELGLSFPQNMGPGDWAPFISEQLNASVYINPSNGMKLFNTADFEQKNIVLQALSFSPFEYETDSTSFVEDLSILDVMMWSSASTIRQKIKELSSIARISN